MCKSPEVEAYMRNSRTEWLEQSRMGQIGRGEERSEERGLHNVGPGRPQQGPGFASGRWKLCLALIRGGTHCV